MAKSEVEEPTDRSIAGRDEPRHDRRVTDGPVWGGRSVLPEPLQPESLPPASHQLELLPPASHQLELLPIELPPAAPAPVRTLPTDAPAMETLPSGAPASGQRQEPPAPAPAGNQPDRGRRTPWRSAVGFLRVVPVLLVVTVAAVGATVAVLNDRPAGAGIGATQPTVAEPAAAANTDLGRLVDPTEVIADPTVLVGKHVDYLYTSQFGYEPPNVPVRTFTVLGRWGPTTDAMPTMPAWAASWVWNPDVRFADGRYVMWFTAAEKNAALPVTGAMPRCIGWATSASPLGPFVPSPVPVLCQLDQFGAIDPRTFVAPGGQEWLYWKSDDNAVLALDKPTIVWAQPLAADGTTLEGRATAILENSAPWEGRIVESPQMVRARGHYYLFFSGNTSGSIDNGIGVSQCMSPAGPCENSSAGPWLGPNLTSQGVGEESLFSQGGSTWMLYSPHSLGQRLEVSRVAFGRRGPYVAAFGRLPSVGATAGRAAAPSR